MMCWNRCPRILVGIALVLLALAAGTRPAIAAGPRIVIVYGPPLAKPVILRNWAENVRLMVAASNTTAIKPAGLKGSIVFALLADNRLLAVRPSTGAVVASAHLGPAPSRPETGYYLALSNDGRTVFALVPGARPDRLCKINAATVRVQSCYRLPADLAFYSLAVGPRTGRIYLFGDRAAGPKRRGPDGVVQPTDAVVAIVNPHTGALLHTWRARAANGYDWYTYRRPVSPDERALFISYHGAYTTGVDSFTVTQAGLQRCAPALGPRQGCIPGHGDIALHGDGLLVTTGSERIEAVDRSGKVRRMLNTRLAGNHLIDFTLDRRTDELYAVGPCGYTGGFSVVDIRTGRTRVLVPTGSIVPPGDGGGLLCGERAALDMRSSLLVVGNTADMVPQLGLHGHLLFLDTRTGQVRRTFTTPSEPVDVLAVTPR